MTASVHGSETPQSLNRLQEQEQTIFSSVYGFLCIAYIHFLTKLCFVTVV